MIHTSVKRIVLLDGEQQFIQDTKEKLAACGTVAVCGEARGLSDVWKYAQNGHLDAILVGQAQETSVQIICQQIRQSLPQTLCIISSSDREVQWDPFLRSIGVWVVNQPIVPEQIERIVSQFSYLAQPPVMYGGPSLYALTGQQSGSGTNSLADVCHQHPTKPKQIIAVYGPKGGVGKTFLSRELAIHFASSNQTPPRRKVLAVDFNLDLGTFATALNLQRTPNIYTWVQEIDEQLTALAKRDRRDPEALCHADWQEYSTQLPLSQKDIERHVVLHEASGVQVITSPRDIRHSFEIKEYHLYAILQALKRSDYDVILIDTAPDTTDATIQALFLAEQVVMVGIPVVDVIENMQRMLKLLREADYPEERIEICMNRLQRREMITLKEMKAYFQLHPDKSIFTIPDDDEVKRAINTGVPLMLTTGRSFAKEAIIKIGNALLPPEKATGQKDEGKKGRVRGSLFSWFKKGGSR